jgi:hypothetical protein
MIEPFWFCVQVWGAFAGLAFFRNAGSKAVMAALKGRSTGCLGFWEDVHYNQSWMLGDSARIN